MKRIVQIFISAVVLTIVPVPAHSLNIGASFSRSLSCALEASRARPKPAHVLGGADYVMSKFDSKIVKSFGKAWMRSVGGTSSQEGVVLILRMVDGTFVGRELGSTNENKKFTFRWHPATIAIVHTHPNRSDPAPQGEDLAVADKYAVPIFTITSRGMYVYDPGTRKTSKVLDNLDWLDPSQFIKAALAKQ